MAGAGRWVALALAALLAGGCAGLRTAPAPVREGYLAAQGGARIFYRVAGSGADTVVVVHDGPGLHMETLAPDLRPLLQGRTLIFYDQRGGGRSTLDPDPDRWIFHTHLSDLRKVLDHFGLRRATLLGVGWGAGLAAVHASNEPERIARLVLVAPVPPRSHPWRDRVQAEVAARLGPEREAQLDSLWARWERGADPAAHCRAYHALRARALAASERRARGSACHAPAEALQAHPRTVDRTRVMHRSWAWLPMLKAVRAPTLVVRGERDPVPAEAAAEWGALPDARLLTLSGAGAMPHVDAPGPFFAAVDRFLRGEWPEGAEPLRPLARPAANPLH